VAECMVGERMQRKVAEPMPLPVGSDGMYGGMAECMVRGCTCNVRCLCQTDEQLCIIFKLCRALVPYLIDDIQPLQEDRRGLMRAKLRPGQPW
jgi:hypothetical protein